MFLTLGYVYVSQIMKVQVEIQKNIYSLFFIQLERIKEIRRQAELMISGLKTDIQDKAVNQASLMGSGLKEKLMSKFNLNNIQKREAPKISQIVPTNDIIEEEDVIKKEEILA